MKFFLEDSEMDAQLQRTATAICSSSADLGEVLATARCIIPGDYDDWYQKWSALAEETNVLAIRANDSRHSVSASKAFLRATEYWRQSIFFIRHDIADPRLQHGWRAHRAAFRAALPLLPWDTTIAEIPFEGARMAAYLLRPEAPSTSRPTILYPCGFDSTAESGYSAIGYMALGRGYNLLLWEGPGQGGTLYDQRIPMRPDFETVLKTVIDWLVTRHKIDLKRLVLIGRSFAGYLAPRAAAFENRLAALVCDPGQVEFVSRLVPAMFNEETWQRILAADPTVEQFLQSMLENPPKREWLGARMATLGAGTVGEFLRMQPSYSIQDQAKDIRCPTLLTEGEGDFASQSQKLFDLLTCEKKLERFTEAQGAGGHCCGLGAALWESITFDWIAEVLDRAD